MLVARGGPGWWSRCSRGFPIAVAVVLAVGCGGSDGGAVDASTPETLAESLDCTSVSELHSMLAPIRGNAATSGLSCEVGDETIHIFARAPIGDTAAIGWTQGGTVENIRRLLGADVLDPDCELAVLISENVFVVGTTADQLKNLGIPGDAPIPASPTISYLEDCSFS